MAIARSKLLFPLVSAVLALYYTLPFLSKITYWGIRDWDLFSTIAGVPAETILHYGQFPFWNPYHAGGNILFHHPEVAVLSPFLLLYLIFGAVIGLKLQVLVCYCLGFWGSQQLFRKLGLSTVAAIVASIAYFGSVHFTLHFAEGHMPFTHYCFLPWFAYFLLLARDHRRAVIGAALSLALIILGNGAAIPLLYTITFTGLLTLLMCVQQRALTDLKNFILSAILGLGIAAVKFVPMVVYLMQNQWPGRPEESIPLTALGPIFFGINHSLFARNFPDQFWNWHEYGAYISPLLVLLAVMVLIADWRRHWIWVVTTVFFLLLGLGNFGQLSPWSLLTHLPGFSSARATGRAFQFVILSVAVLGGFGFDWALARAHRLRQHRVGSGIVYLTAVVIAGSNLIFAWPIMNSSFVSPGRDIYRSAAFRHVINPDTRMYANFLANRGSLIAPELSASYPSRALVGPGDTVLMEYVLGGDIEVVQRRYTPNRITYAVTGRQPGPLAISMGYDPGWRATDGRSVSEWQGVISFMVNAGPDRVELVYRTPYFFLGLAVSILFLIVLTVQRWST